MSSEVSLDNIINFHKAYTKNSANQKAETKIRELGLAKASVDERHTNFNFRFNLKLPNKTPHNQYQSYQCYSYAFVNVVEDIIRKNSHETITLSSNFLDFYDKLEKVNTFYNLLLKHSNISEAVINATAERVIGLYGNFHFCRNLMNKYGIVPAEAMPNATANFDGQLMIELLKDKVKGDALALRTVKGHRARIKCKNDLMYETYEFLSKVFGNPPLKFKYGKQTFTPLEFKSTFVQEDLADYITTTPFNLRDFQRSYAYVPNIYLKDNETFHQASMNEICNAIIGQLRDGVGIWFSAEESTICDDSTDILDDHLHDYENLLNIKQLSPSKQLRLNFINYDHAMCITGAQVDDDVASQYLVADSLCTRGKHPGQMIMTPSFLQNRVITLVLNQKFLRQEMGG